MKKIFLTAIVMLAATNIFALNVKTGYNVINDEYSSFFSGSNMAYNRYGEVTVRADATKTNKTHQGKVLLSQKIESTSSPYFAQITGTYAKDSVLAVDRSSMSGNVGIMSYPDLYTKIAFSFGGTYRGNEFVGNVRVDYEYDLSRVHGKANVLLEGVESEILLDGTYDLTSILSIGSNYLIKNRNSTRSTSGSLYIGILI